MSDVNDMIDFHFENRNLELFDYTFFAKFEPEVCIVHVFVKVAPSDNPSIAVVLWSNFEGYYLSHQFIS